MIAAVLFDLDDTLFPLSAWIDGAWRAVAARATAYGATSEEVYDSLVATARGASDASRTIKGALARCGRTDIPVSPLSDAFRSYAPSTIDAYPGVLLALVELRESVPIGIVTDGDPSIQRAKLRALQFDVDVVVCSDEIGREHRKPDPLPFCQALETLGVCAHDAVFVGDQPDRDIAGAQGIGMRGILVRTGEHASMSPGTKPWRIADTTLNAIELLRAELRAP
jgi:FMN phosphatase YigB (HAD superfamily)